jgi:hypothetical protein
MMRRIVRVGWLVTALLSAAVLIAFWWRSGHVMDEWSLVDEDNTLRAVVSFRGSLHVIRAKNNSTKRPLGWDTQQISPTTTAAANLHARMGVEWRRAGFARVSSFAVPAPPPQIAVPVPPPPATAPSTVRRSTARSRPPANPVVLPPPAMTAVAPWLLTRPYDAWVIPYWAPVLAAGLVPAVLMLVGTVRHFVRQYRGRCDACGYDLRASPERCPECGYPIRMRRRAHVPDGSLDADADAAPAPTERPSV